jgi:hypothetical protein
MHLPNAYPRGICGPSPVDLLHLELACNTERITFLYLLSHPVHGGLEEQPEQMKTSANPETQE